MLVLSRNVGEQIVVPHLQLTVTIVSVHGNRVRLGISAPAEIAVYREEIGRQDSQQTTEPDRQQAGYDQD